MLNALMLVLSTTSAWQAQGGRTFSTEDEFEKRTIARFQARSWLARAAYFGSDYGHGPERQCRLTTPGATLTQARPNESGRMPANWVFLEHERREHDNLEINSVELAGRRYEVANLPWRLVKPAGDIVLTFEKPLLAVRDSRAAQWLPFEYLTLQMLNTRDLKITYSYDSPEEETNGARTRVGATKMIDLTGLKEASKWCGRQLLIDRRDEAHVRALTD